MMTEMIINQFTITENCKVALAFGWTPALK